MTTQALEQGKGARFLEFMLLGGATLLLFPLAWLLEKSVGLSASELAAGFLTFHAATLINDPHFAVTYLLFYKDIKRRAWGRAFPPMQRARYVVAGLLVPLALGALAFAAISRGSARWLGFMMELMFFLVGWHYAKQGFGILTVFSARQGFRYEPLERKVILGHCFAGWAYAWASPHSAAMEVEEKGVVYTSLPHPPTLELVTLVVFGASAVALFLMLGRRWLRDRRLPPLSPLAGFLITIWLWTVYTSLNRIMMYLIPALHSIQYLYVVWLLKRNEAREAEGPPLFGKPTALRLVALAASSVALGWVLFRGAPAVLDEKRALSGMVGGAGGATAVGDAASDLFLGPTPYFAAFFAIVNIHHYFMDNVIWRRENPDTRFLRDNAG